MKRIVWIGILGLVLAACTAPVTESPRQGTTPDFPPSATPTPWDGGPVHADYRVRGAIVGPNGLLDPGEMTVSGDEITCVAPSCPVIESNVPVIDTKGAYVFPGLVDLHNHTAYDFITPWNPPQLYENRYQWQGDPDYQDHKQPYSDNSSSYICEMVKYAEIASITAGVTTTEGAPRRKCADVLARNVEHYNGFGVDWIRTSVTSISGLSATDADSITAQMDSGETRAYLVHLSEGIDESSLGEFTTLEDLGLLRRETVVIHGTALQYPELQQMGELDMHLVWSPESNLVLYGQTTDVATAKEAGVTLSLAPDWTLSGSLTMLGELRVASQYSDDEGGLFSDSELLQMVTENPADAVSYGDRIGRLAAGNKADFIVVTDLEQYPPATALAQHATRENIALVAVGGELLYGSPDLMALDTDELTETVQVCGQTRLLNVALPTLEDGKDQTFADIRNEIESLTTPVVDPLACTL